MYLICSITNGVSRKVRGIFPNEIVLEIHAMHVEAGAKEARAKKKAMAQQGHLQSEQSTFDELHSLCVKQRIFNCRILGKSPARLEFGKLRLLHRLIWLTEPPIDRTQDLIEAGTQA